MPLTSETSRPVWLIAIDHEPQEGFRPGALRGGGFDPFVRLVDGLEAEARG